MATSVNQFNEDKELLLMRIKDLEFVDDVSEFQCKRCQKVLIQHYISDCGHAFCSNCKRLLGDGSGRWPCLHCHEFVKEIDLQDFEFERRLFDLRVRCANTKYGCHVICPLKELGKHLKTCEFTRENALPVLYEGPKTAELVLEQMMKLNETFAKLNDDMEAIKAKVETNQTEVDNKLAEINARVDLMNSDLHVIIANINNKIAKIESCELHLQSNMETHFREMKSSLEFIYDEKLSKTQQKLKQELADDRKSVLVAINANADKIDHVYADFTARLKNADDQMQSQNEKVELLGLKLQSRVKTIDYLKVKTLEEEILLVKNKVNEMQAQMSSVNPQLFRLESYIHLIKQQVQPIATKEILSHRLPDYIWEVADAKNLLRQDKRMEIESETFRLNDYPSTARATLSVGEYFLYVRVRFNTEMESPLHQYHQPSMYLIIRNREDKRDSDILVIASKESQLVHKDENSRHFINISKSHFTGFFNPYVKNNTLLLEFHVESPGMTRHAYSYDGTLSWTIENYKKTTELNPDGSFHESPYFYVAPDGYRAQVCFWLDSIIDEHKHVYASIHFLNGEFDKEYEMHEIPHKFTVTYLNQKNSNEHIIKSRIYNPKEFVNAGLSTYCCIECGKAELERVVANDVLHYHVKIEIEES